MRKILILDDNLTICLMLRSWLQKEGYDVEIASSGKEALQLIRTTPFDMVLSDIRMPEIDGFEFLSIIKRYDSDILVIMMTSYADIESAVESLKLGAVDYIPKPIDPDILFAKIKEAFEAYENSREATALQQEMHHPEGYDNKQLSDWVFQVVRDEPNLLLMGEEGTGKSTLANYIYLKSNRTKKPLGVFDLEFHSFDTLEESKHCVHTLHEKIEKCQGGMLHIQNFRKPSTMVQSAFIDILSKRDKKLIIIISTTLTQEELKKSLLPKLSDLLFENCLELPPISGNEAAIASFVRFFVKIANRELNKDIQGVDKEVFEVLYKHKYETNIQELKNLVFKACLLTDENRITKSLIPELFNRKEMQRVGQSVMEQYGNIERLRKENFEKQKIMEALDISKGNKTMAASILNIDRKTLYNKIRLYKIEAN